MRVLPIPFCELLQLRFFQFTIKHQLLRPNQSIERLGLAGKMIQRHRFSLDILYHKVFHPRHLILHRTSVIFLQQIRDSLFKTTSSCGIQEMWLMKLRKTNERSRQSAFHSSLRDGPWGCLELLLSDSIRTTCSRPSCRC